MYSKESFTPDEWTNVTFNDGITTTTFGYRTLSHANNCFMRIVDRLPSSYRIQISLDAGGTWQNVLPVIGFFSSGANIFPRGHSGFNNRHVFAVSSPNQVAYTDNNGSNWSLGSSLTGTAGRYTWQDSKLMRPRDTSTRLQISTNGSLTFLSSITTLPNVGFVRFGNGVWLWIWNPTSGVPTIPVLYRSTDGGSTYSPIVTPLHDYIDAGYLNGVWVVIASTAGKSIRSTDDGLTWSVINTPVGTWTSMAVGNDKMVIVGSTLTLGGSRAITSYDNGIKWVEDVTSNNIQCASVIFGQGRFVATGNPISSLDKTSIMYKS